MKFLSKSVLEGGTILNLTPPRFETIPPTGRTRINIYDVERQEILGFGGAFTESSAFVYAQMEPAAKAHTMELLFGAGGLRYNLCRLCIGSSDFSLDQYDYLADGDETLASFSIERDLKYVIPMVKDAIKTARAQGEEILFFASPWSPPAFMKDNKSRIKGRLLPEYYPLYAEYVVKFIESYEAHGIHISAITPQNEPYASSPWDGCRFDTEEEIELIKHLALALKAHGLDVKILAFDHNKGRLYHRLEKIYREIGDMVVGAGFHWYGGSHFDELALLHERYPDKLILQTEFCNGLGRKIFDSYGAELIGNFTHWCNASCEWNLLLGPLGEPYHDRAFGCSAPLHSDGHEITKRQSYYETYLFSHFLRRGAKALATSSFCEDLRAAAFRNPDGNTVIVLRNTADRELEFNLSVFDRLIPLSITPRSMATYVLAAD